jgi:hypothetical protein
MALRACSAAASASSLFASVAYSSVSARCFSSVSATAAAAAAPSVIAYVRPEIGSRESQRARQNGLIPGIIYGGGVSKERRVYVHEETIRKEMHKRKGTFLSSVLDL